MNVITRGNFSPISDPKAYHALWALMDNHETFMMTTHRNEQLRSRPMVGYPEKEENTIWFLAEAEYAKDNEIAQVHHICVTLSKNRQDYISLSGQAFVVNNIEKKKELWNLAAQAWLKKPIDDPNLLLIAFTPDYGEYWKSDKSSIGTFFEMAKALISSDKPDVGQNRKVKF
jgi:general stress protein 26